MRRPARRTAGTGLAAALALGLALAGSPEGVATTRAADPLDAAPPATVSAATAPAATLGGVPRVVWRGARTDRVVALTFDDGWSAATLRSIYRTLVREDVAATFFVTGMYVRRAPELWRQIAARFPIANHSNRHRDTRRLTDGEAIADLIRARVALEHATGRPMLPLFRPPYGARNERTDRLAAAAGFPTVVMWNVSSTDTVRPTSTRSVIRSASAGRSGSIVLLHAGPRVTARALPEIIARYRARGFRFVTVPELLGMPLAGVPASAVAPRDLDRTDDAPGGAATANAAAGAGDRQPAAEPAPEPAPPAIPVLSPEPAAPARDRAWARSAGTPWALATGTAAALGALLLAAVMAGRGRREDEPGP